MELVYLITVVTFTKQ